MWSQSPIYNLQIWKIRNYQNVMSNLLTCQIRTLISTWQAWRILFTSVSYHVLKHGDFFLGHNLLYCGLKQDILLSFVAFDKICKREMRAGAKLRFQHIFREMRASGAKKRDQSECKTDNSLRFQPHFLAPSNPFPVFLCVWISHQLPILFILLIPSSLCFFFWLFLCFFFLSLSSVFFVLLFPFYDFVWFSCRFVSLPWKILKCPWKISSSFLYLCFGL